MPKQKLTVADVKTIYERYASGKYNEFDLSYQFNVKPDTVLDIINRRTWQDLNLPPLEELRYEKHKKAWAARALLDEGNSYFEIGMRMGISPHEVLELVEDYGEN